ncbi:MAG: NUDIX hydrolase [Acidobacteria bacterium]|nr:NUDIX hydrolase [Acidobacteriota bacterium]
MDRTLYRGSFRPAAGVLICRGREVILIRRAGDPGRGSWDIPGGFLEPGETPAAAARREIREELGVELGPLDLLLTDINPLPAFTVLDLIYTAPIAFGVPRAGSDAAAWGWFHRDALPEDLAFATTRRILERWRTSTYGNNYRLLGGTRLPLDESTRAAVLAPPWQQLPAGWQPRHGDWRIHDKALCGSVEGEHPAVLWCETPVPGDHAILFQAATVPPRHNDINCYWEGSGDISQAGDPQCTIGGVGGWWDGLTGIERYPEGGLRASGRLLSIQPGRMYEICAGRWGGSDFIFIDGRLAVQLDDPAATRRTSSRVALATWNSHVHFASVQVCSLPAAPGS